MIRILVDDNDVRSTLDGCQSKTEICDQDGRVLGIYIPAAVRERRLYELAKAQMTPEFIEELERRTREPGGYTTAEVMQKLRDLEATDSNALQ